MHEGLLHIKLLAMDADGVLTDGSILYGSGSRDEIKVFNIWDGLGISVARHAGLLTAILSGRASAALARRADELKVTILCQSCRDKGTAVRNLREQFNLKPQELAFVGDDINDIPAFQESGYRIAVRNASEDLRVLADYVTNRPGGGGAIREVIETILRAQGKWADAVARLLCELQQGGRECRI